MATQIIILEDQTKAGQLGWRIKYLFWFAVPVAQRVPLSTFTSAYQDIPTAELNALRAGAVLEEVYEDYFPVGEDLDGPTGVKHELVIRWNNRQAEIQARGTNPMRLHGRRYDGATGLWS